MPKNKPTLDTRNLKQIDNYEHKDKFRYNIPPVAMAQHDTVASPEAKYEYDPHIDPSLQWAQKKEGTSFEVPTTSIHIHEVIKPYKIIHTNDKSLSGHMGIRHTFIFDLFTG